MYDLISKFSRGIVISIFLVFVFSIGLAYGSPPSFSFMQQFNIDMFSARMAYIDSDSYVDLVFSSSGNGTYIAYGNSSYEFDTPVKVLPSNFSTVIINYVNTDTLLDVITVSGDGTETGFVLVNNGNRTYDTVSFAATGIDNYAALGAGYFNNDAYLDVVCGTISATSARIYFGDGSGAFPTDTIFPFGLGGVAVGDFDEDGFDDIVSKPFGEEVDTVAILLNDGNGHFSISGKAWSPGSSPGITTANGSADFNNDGHTDFALSAFIDPPNSYLSVGLGDGNGGISQLDTFHLIGYHLFLDAVDVDADNNMDIVSEGPSSYSPGPHLAIYTGDGAGGFNDTTLVAHPTSIAACALAYADIDLDGDVDFVSGRTITGIGAITIMYNQLYSPSPDKSGSLPKVISISAATQTSSRLRAGGSSETSVKLDITDPHGRRFKRDIRSIAGAGYWRHDADGDGMLDEQVLDHAGIGGTYRIVVRPNPSALSGSPFSLRINVPGAQEAVLAKNYDYFSGGAANDSVAFLFTNSSLSPVQPRQGGATGTAVPTFRWPTVPGTTRYEFQLDRYHDFRAPRYSDDMLTSPHFSVSSPLGEDSVFYWRYRSFNGMTWSDYSPTYAAYVKLCCTGIRGNANGDPNEMVNILDFNFIVAYMFSNGQFPDCGTEADMNADGSLNILDLVYINLYMFDGGPAPLPCPAQ